MTEGVWTTCCFTGLHVRNRTTRRCPAACQFARPLADELTALFIQNKSSAQIQPMEDDTYAILIFVAFAAWFVLSVVAANVARSKGRSGCGFLLLSMLLSPVIGLLIAFVMTPDTQRLNKQNLRAGQSKKCPDCAEVIKSEARVCRFCGRRFSDREVKAHTKQAGVLSAEERQEAVASHAFEEGTCQRCGRVKDAVKHFALPCDVAV